MCEFKAAPTLIPSATPATIISTINALLLHSNPPTPGNDTRNGTYSNWMPQTALHIYNYTLGCLKFPELYLGYYHIKDQALKKCTALVQPSLHVGGGEM